MAERRRDLFCKRCIKKYRWLYLEFGEIKWKNIIPIKPVGENGLLVRCGNCGHEYVSYSMAALKIRNRLGQKL